MPIPALALPDTPSRTRRPVSYQQSTYSSFNVSPSSRHIPERNGPLCCPSHLSRSFSSQMYSQRPSLSSSSSSSHIMPPRTAITSSSRRRSTQVLSSAQDKRSETFAESPSVTRTAMVTHLRTRDLRHQDMYETSLSPVLEATSPTLSTLEPMQLSTKLSSQTPPSSAPSAALRHPPIRSFPIYSSLPPPPSPPTPPSIDALGSFEIDGVVFSTPRRNRDSIAFTPTHRRSLSASTQASSQSSSPSLRSPTSLLPIGKKSGRESVQLGSGSGFLRPVTRTASLSERNRRVSVIAGRIHSGVPLTEPKATVGLGLDESVKLATDSLRHAADSLSHSSSIPISPSSHPSVRVGGKVPSAEEDDHPPGREARARRRQGVDFHSHAQFSEVFNLSEVEIEHDLIIQHDVMKTVEDEPPGKGVAEPPSMESVVPGLYSNEFAPKDEAEMDEAEDFSWEAEEIASDTESDSRVLFESHLVEESTTAVAESLILNHEEKVGDTSPTRMEKVEAQDTEEQSITSRPDPLVKSHKLALSLSNMVNLYDLPEDHLNSSSTSTPDLLPPDFDYDVDFDLDFGAEPRSAFDSDTESEDGNLPRSRTETRGRFLHSSPHIHPPLSGSTQKNKGGKLRRLRSALRGSVSMPSVKAKAKESALPSTSGPVSCSAPDVSPVAHPRRRPSLAHTYGHVVPGAFTSIASLSETISHSVHTAAAAAGHLGGLSALPLHSSHTAQLPESSVTPSPSSSQSPSNPNCALSDPVLDIHGHAPGLTPSSCDATPDSSSPIGSPPDLPLPPTPPTPPFITHDPYLHHLSSLGHTFPLEHLPPSLLETLHSDPYVSSHLAYTNAIGSTGMGQYQTNGLGMGADVCVEERETVDIGGGCRLTVVDPDESMKMLEMSMAKLGVYRQGAPQREAPAIMEVDEDEGDIGDGDELTVVAKLEVEEAVGAGDEEIKAGMAGVLVDAGQASNDDVRGEGKKEVAGEKDEPGKIDERDPKEQTLPDRPSLPITQSTSAPLDVSPLQGGSVKSISNQHPASSIEVKKGSAVCLKDRETMTDHRPPSLALLPLFDFERPRCPVKSSPTIPGVEMSISNLKHLRRTSSLIELRDLRTHSHSYSHTPSLSSGSSSSSHSSSMIDLRGSSMSSHPPRAKDTYYTRTSSSKLKIRTPSSAPAKSTPFLLRPVRYDRVSPTKTGRPRTAPNGSSPNRSGSSGGSSPFGRYKLLPLDSEPRLRTASVLQPSEVSLVSDEHHPVQDIEREKNSKVRRIWECVGVKKIEKSVRGFRGSSLAVVRV